VTAVARSGSLDRGARGFGNDHQQILSRLPQLRRSSIVPTLALHSIGQLGCIVEHSLVFAFDVGFGRRADDSNVRKGASAVAVATLHRSKRHPGLSRRTDATH
jgi:hypothetical protein